MMRISALKRNDLPQETLFRLLEGDHSLAHTPRRDEHGEGWLRNSEILLFSHLAQYRAAATWVVVVHISYTTLRILLELRFRYTEFLD